MRTKQAKNITPLAPKLSAPNIPQTAPNSENLERRIIANSLGQKTYAYQVVTAVGDKPMFFYRKHQMIYDALRELINNDIEPDYMRLIEELQRRGQLEELEAPASLTKMLADESRNRFGVPDYAGDLDSLKGYYARYQLLLVSDKLNKQAYDLTIAPTELLQEAQKNLSDVGDVIMNDLFVSVGEQAQQHADKTEQNKHDTITYIPTGIKYLDNDQLIRGLRKGKTIVVAGYTNHGKTVVSMSVAYNVAESGHNVIVFNVADGTKHDVFSRFVAMNGGINFGDVSANNVTQNQYGKYIEALSAVTKMSDNLHIQAQKAMRIDTLETQAKAIAAKMPVDLIVVDYIGRLTVEPFIDDPKTGRKIANPDNATKVLRMGHISQRLITLGEKLDCAMMINAQINRQGAGKMPDIGHIKDSGNIGEDADLVLLVYKEGLDNYGYEFPNQIQIKIGKNKVNGNFGTALTTVDPQSTYVTSQILNR